MFRPNRLLTRNPQTPYSSVAKITPHPDSNVEKNATPRWVPALLCGVRGKMKKFKFGRNIFPNLATHIRKNTTIAQQEGKDASTPPATLVA